MKKYIMHVTVGTNVNGSAVQDKIDLMKDCNFSEDECIDIMKNEERLNEIAVDWMWEHVDFGYSLEVKD